MRFLRLNGQPTAPESNVAAMCDNQRLNPAETFIIGGGRSQIALHLSAVC